MEIKISVESSSCGCDYGTSIVLKVKEKEYLLLKEIEDLLQYGISVVKVKEKK